MFRITADDLLMYARRLQGQELHTLHQSKAFTAEVDGDHVVYVPLASGKERRHDKTTLQPICSKFNRENSLKPSDYDEVNTQNASYTLAVIAKYLGSVVDGTIKPSPKRR